jgi:hypothetical protein
MYPINPIGRDDSVHAVTGAELLRARRETDEEAAERRRRQAEEQEQQRQEEARAKGEPVPAVPGKPAIVAADAAPDGHPHCDIRV